MTFMKWWRLLAPLVGIIYTGWAYQQMLRGDKLWSLLSCFIAAIYFHGAAKAHSRMKRQQRRRYND